MVEGHGVHRVAAAHRRLLLGRRFAAISPNGRFTEGAAAVDGAVLSRVEAHGKNLFYFFDTSTAAAAVIHIHFGMAGQFATAPLTDPLPPTKPTTRLRLISHGPGARVVADLSAMTCVLGDAAFYAQKVAALGPDPLRPGDDCERLWARLPALKQKPIGAVLMDQACVAGIGNIYRAEVLFKAGVHPEQSAASIDRPTFERLWAHSVALLRRGFVTGSILTVDPAEAKLLGPPWTRRYIYGQSRCGRCSGRVTSFAMAGRTVYMCGGTCQKMREGAAAAAPGLPAALADSVSSPVEPDLREFGLGLAPGEVFTAAYEQADEEEAIASPAAAAAEKRRAGEGRNVEHVALIDATGMGGSAGAGRKRKTAAGAAADPAGPGAGEATPARGAGKGRKAAAAATGTPAAGVAKGSQSTR